MTIKAKPTKNTKSIKERKRAKRTKLIKRTIKTNIEKAVLKQSIRAYFFLKN